MSAARQTSGFSGHAAHSATRGVALRLAAAAVVALALVAGVLAPSHAVLAAGAAPDPTRSLATTDTTPSVPATSTPATSSPNATASVPATTATFARMAGTRVDIHLPAGPKKLVAVGFHQADNKKAVRFVPLMKCHARDKAATMKALIKKGAFKLFQQPLRGRGSSNFSAADCAVPPKTVVVAPVSGVVTNVRSYKLYGYINDLRLEIKPDGSPHLRVVMIHITGVKVKKGQRVVGGITPVATVRHLPLNSTINRFVPVKPVDHVHIQVNLDTFKGSY
jgi:hypothetical protein